MGGFSYRGVYEPVGSLQFLEEAIIPIHSEGLVFYDPNEKTLAVYNNESDVTLQLGQEIYVRATNKSGNPILNGTLVYVTGAQGSRPTIAPAKANAAETCTVLAIATHDIGDNLTGFCTSFGLVRGLNTSNENAGDPVYLSAADAGEWTKVAPSEPNFAIQVGTVLFSNNEGGVIFVNMGPTDVVGHMIISSIALLNQLNMKEITTPTAVPDYGAVYAKADNKLYFQDGAGVEHEVAFTA